jgi:hypothetical protein
MKLNRSLTNSEASTVESFHKLMPSQLREMYSLKLLDAPAYVLLIVQTHGAAGWKWTFKVKDFCQEWGISKSAFYRAVSKLKDLDLLNWETDGSITVWHGSDIAKSIPSSGNLVPVSGKNFPLEGMPVPVSGMENAEILTGQELQNPSDYYSDNIRSTTNKEATAVVDLKEIVPEPEADQAEVDAALVQLRSLNVKLNPTVRRVVRSHLKNVPDAIAHLKERISSGENFGCLEAAFVKACKEGVKPEAMQSPPVDLPQPSPAQFEALQAAKQNRSIKDYYLAPWSGGKTFLVDDWRNQRVVVWWEFLKVGAIAYDP